MALSLRTQLLNTAQIKRNYLEKPAGLQWRSSKLFVTVTLGIGLFTDLFLYSLVVPVLPFMLADRIGLPLDQIQDQVSSLLAAYAGASTVVSPFIGIVTDRLGTRRLPFLAGLAALILSTLLLLLGRTINVLLVARVLQGISAAVVWTTGLALCLETVGAENLGKAIGSIFGCISIGNLVAPMLGGVLYHTGGLVGVFGLAFAVLGIDFVMRLLVIEARVARLYDSANDPTDNAAAADSIEDEQHPHEEEAEVHDDETTSLLGRKKDSLEAYIISPDLPRLMRIIPILPCLADSRLVAALTIAFVQAVLLGSIDATVPVVSQEYYGFSSLRSGLMFLPIGITNLIFGPLLGWSVDKLGSKKMAVLVYLYLAPVLVLFRIVSPGGSAQVAVYAMLLGLAGIGVAGMGAPSVVEASIVVQNYYQANPDYFGQHGPYAQLYSLSYLFYSLGLTVGPELAGRLRQSIGYGNMNAVLAVICALTALVSFLFLGEKSNKTKHRGVV